MGNIKITNQGALSLLEQLYCLNGIAKTCDGNFVVVHDDGWYTMEAWDAAEDLAEKLGDVDLIISKIIELGGMPCVPDLVVNGLVTPFDNTTALGEPQAWIYLRDGSSIEITHEEDGLKPKDQYFTLRHHCCEKDFDNDTYHSTMGVIEQCSGGLSDIEPTLSRIIGEKGFGPAFEDTANPAEIDRILIDLQDWGRHYPTGAIAYNGDTIVASEYCETVEEFKTFFETLAGNLTADARVIVEMDVSDIYNSIDAYDPCMDFIGFIAELKEAIDALKEDKNETYHERK